MRFAKIARHGTLILAHKEGIVMLSQKQTTLTRLIFGVGVLFTAVMVVLIAAVNAAGTSTPNNSQQSYLPVVHKPFPTPTPTPTPMPPAFVTNVHLQNALCPNAIGVNEHSGIIYVANSYSNDVSMVRDGVFLGNVPIGQMPTDIASIPNSNRTYITHLTDTPGVNQIAVFDQTTLVDRLPDHFEPHDIIYNPVNGYIYVTDLDSTVRVIKGTGANPEIVDVYLPNAGWVRSIEVDPLTGLVYAPSWERGIVYVINNTTLVTQFQAGWGTLEISIEPQSGYFYLAHSDPNATYPQNISVFHRNDYTVTPIYTAAKSWDVATEPIFGLAYVTNPESNSVTVLSGRGVVANLAVGQRPQAVATDPGTGYAFVGNHDSNTVTILRNGVIRSTQPTGYQPYAIVVNKQTHEVFVANRAWRIECDWLDRCYPICREHPPTVTILR